MYDEIKEFLEGKDQNFQTEVENIQKGKEVKIITRYRSSDAYKRLKKRQGLAIAKLE